MNVQHVSLRRAKPWRAGRAFGRWQGTVSWHWISSCCFILFLLNGVFAMSELAIASSRKTRLQQWAEEGRTRRGGALQLAEHPNRFLATVQIGITLIGIVTGFYGGATLSEPVARLPGACSALAPYSQAIAVVLVVGLVTYLSLLIGELVPKRLALQNPERIAMLVAPPMTALSRVAAPLVSFLGGFV